MSGYCSLQASRSPSRPVARWTWPSEAAAAGLKSKSANARASRARVRPACAGARRPRPSAALATGAGQLGGELGGQRIGDRRQHLRDLHQRALHRAQCLSERLGVRFTPARRAAGSRRPRRERAGVDAKPGISGRPRAQAIGFVVGCHAVGLRGLVPQPALTPSPRVRRSSARSPKGRSSRSRDPLRRARRARAARNRTSSRPP